MNRSHDINFSQPVLVLGGSDKTGSRVPQRLAARGVAVRVGLRSGTTPLDWEYPDTWALDLYNDYLLGNCTSFFAA